MQKKARGMQRNVNVRRKMTHNTYFATENNNFKRNDTGEDVAKAKRKQRKIPKCVRYEEFFKLIGAVSKKDFTSRIAFLLAYGTGMRISEVLRCRKEHFNVNSIFIPESKYGVERIVPIPKGWKFDFLNRLPLKTTARTLERRFKKFANKCNLPEYYSFHSLRHGFATRCLEQGMPINQVQVLMGHSNISTTSIYVKANPSDALKSFEELF